MIGLVMYFIASKPETKEVGRLAFAVGLLSFLLKAAEPALHIP